MLGRLKFEIDALVEQRLDQLPEEAWVNPSFTFCDYAMGGGQFIKPIIARLRSYGHADSNIASRVYGFESNKLYPLYAINKNKLIGIFEHKSLDELDSNNMIFDFVVGNPPYQNGGVAGNFALWPLFITKAAASLKDGGHLSFIVPQTWASNAIIAKKNAKDMSVVRSTVLSTGRLIDVDFTVGKYFNVGSTFSAFTWQKNRTGLTRVTTECGDHSVDYTTLPWLPIFGGELTLSILTKTVWGEHPKEALINDGKEICGFRNGSVKVSDSKSSKFLNLIANTSAQYSKGIYLYSAEKQSCHGVAKIIFSDSGYAKPFYDKTGEYGLGHHARGIAAKTQKKANAIICMMESKLTRFIAQTKCETGTASAIARIQDCLLSLDAPMTDAEIYKKFNLSAAEIKLIESTVQ